MAFTQSQLDALEMAIASGTLTVKYGDKQVTYHDVNAMLRVRGIMQRELGIAPSGSRTTYAEFRT